MPRSLSHMIGSRRQMTMEGGICLTRTRPDWAQTVSSQTQSLPLYPVCRTDETYDIPMIFCLHDGPTTAYESHVYMSHLSNSSSLLCTDPHHYCTSWPHGLNEGRILRATCPLTKAPKNGTTTPRSPKSCLPMSPNLSRLCLSLFCGLMY